jgi:hypothetical protein
MHILKADHNVSGESRSSDGERTSSGGGGANFGPDDLEHGGDEGPALHDEQLHAPA